ncbi:MAG: FAD-binding oxidoreductase [bacterium]|nr:FAD-binding oxidoreductase [bacterium]
MSATARQYQSWSRLPFGASAFALVPARADEVRRPSGGDGSGQSLLPFGRGRTYGDTCVNPGHGILDTRRLDRMLEFDAERGIVSCESGVSLASLLALVVPHGWFVPVCPGTKHVSIGGAVAHDVHGKNQREAGTFGCHVERLVLWRSDGQRLDCARDENAELFAATIGGLGLTGLILSVELRLQRVTSAQFDVQRVRCTGLDDLLACETDGEDFAYSVAWIDSLRPARAGLRCILMRGRHASGPLGSLTAGRPRARGGPQRWAPAALFNRTTVRVFNRFYYRQRTHGGRLRRQHFDAFLFPQDTLHDSNHLYGTRGVYAYHCLLPLAVARDAAAELLERVSRRGDESLVTVLKVFGDRRSPGILSFGRAGLSLVCGFPNQGERTLRLMGELDAIVRAAGGMLYPAKDARLPAAMFRTSFPAWESFAQHVDPHFSSSFWRRVTGTG